MNYRLNLVLMLVVFSVVTYNVCMAYQDMNDVSVQGKFEEIGLLQDSQPNFIIPAKKPSLSAQLAAL